MKESGHVAVKGRIKRMQLRSSHEPILCLFRNVLVIVLVIVIGFFSMVFEYEYGGEDDDDRMIAPLTRCPWSVVGCPRGSGGCGAMSCYGTNRVREEKARQFTGLD